jgi:hypothetical protein
MPGLLWAVIEKARQRARRRRRRYLRGLLVIALAGIGLYLWLGNGPAERGGPGAARHGEMTLTDVRSFEAPQDEVRWTIDRAAGGRCYELFASAVRGEDRAQLSGNCASHGPLSSGLGGVEIAGRWYNVIDGTAGRGVSRVRVVLRDGTTRTERAVGGVWLVVVPGPDPMRENSFDVSRIEALDPSGDVLARERPTSVRRLYALARSQATLPHD